MTAPNHVTGGMVFTGLFCSLFTINIFSNPLYISVCILGSLLPDIDHTKSIIGKAFYPLSKWISIHYGHRTITHSLLFILSITLISVFIENNFSDNLNVSIILFFSVFSHFILDMVTMQGIPLFYPFYKNPCVLPANPELRISSGNLKQEGIALFIFAFMTLFMQDLFAQGFWSSINNNFNDIKHKVQEFKGTNNALQIVYDYQVYQDKYKGSGYLIQAETDNLYILNNQKIIHLNKSTPGLKITLLKTKKTTKKILQEQFFLSNENQQKTNSILKNKFILSATIYTSAAAYLKDNPNEIKQKFTFSNAYNPMFHTSLNDSLESQKINKINELELKITAEENKLINDNKIYYESLTKLKKEKSNLNRQLSHFEINETKKNIIQLERIISNFDLKENALIQAYKDQIQEVKNRKNKIISFTGELVLITVSD